MKKKANTIYHYVVESARVDGKPRIVHQTYLGTAESVARLVQDRTAPKAQLPEQALALPYPKVNLIPLRNPSRQSLAVA